MVFTLDMYTDYLLCSTGQTSATGLSRLHEGAVSHDQVTRLLHTAALTDKALWLASKPLIRQAEARRPADDFAVLIVDDSILEKAHTDANALICTHWDHCGQRFVRGLNFVTLFYEAPGVALPIAAELIRKTEPVTVAKTQKVKHVCKFTKNEYLRIMLDRAQQQVAYRYLLADSWYAAADNLRHVRALGHHYLMALKSSRTVALNETGRQQGQFQALASLEWPDKQPLRVYLRGVAEAALVVRQVFTNKDGSTGVLYLVSSDTDLDWAQITAIYQRRWKVEEYHKSLKQNASLGKSPTKTLATQTNHFLAAMLAYIKLEGLKIRHALGHFRMKAQLYLVGLKAMNQELIRLAA